MNKEGMQRLEEQIEKLARLVTNGGFEDQRFRMAVGEFKLFLENAEKNHLPQDLVKALRDKKMFVYDNQQSYVDDLRREWKDYCQKINMQTITRAVKDER